MPSDVIDETVQLNDEARSRVQGGATYAEAADWLRTQPGVATVETEGDALRFRPVGGRPMWIVAAATFRGPTVSERASFRLASFQVPKATPAPAVDSLVGGDVESKTALVLSPYLWNFDPFDSGPPVAGVLEQTRGYAGNVTQLANAKKTDQTVGLEEFEHWDDYDIVFVSSHGARICFANSCRAVIAAGQLPANEPLLSHQQLQHLRASGIELVTDSTGSTGMLLGADFFRTYYPNGLEDTLVIIDACQTLGPKVSDIADALRGTTSEYIGWTETVGSDVATNATVALLQKLSEGVTVKHAYDSLGSLKNDPATGAQLTLAGRPAGDLRIREIVSFRDVTGASQLAPGAPIKVVGTPDDGMPDRVPWHVVVEGLDGDEAGATPLHVTIEGTTADTVFVSDGSELGPGIWLVDGEVALTSDLHVGQQLAMRASVDLVDMDTSTTEVNVKVADVSAGHCIDTGRQLAPPGSTETGAFTGRNDSCLVTVTSTLSRSALEASVDQRLGSLGMEILDKRDLANIGGGTLWVFQRLPVDGTITLQLESPFIIEIALCMQEGRDSNGIRTCEGEPGT